MRWVGDTTDKHVSTRAKTNVECIQYIPIEHNIHVYTWWLIPLSKWVSSPQWFTWDFCRVNPLKKLGWTNPLTIRGMSHQVMIMNIMISKQNIATLHVLSGDATFPFGASFSTGRINRIHPSEPPRVAKPTERPCRYASVERAARARHISRFLKCGGSMLVSIRY